MALGEKESSNATLRQQMAVASMGIREPNKVRKWLWMPKATLGNTITSLLCSKQHSN
jgi:hypothetical protein